ncbi:hypothetical protein GCM10011416_23820 [Polaribacter pacificus]|uniref:Uncharacterized protein n=1 Tax=Polaribacter pacificus TaxID=1775173 RepID=A0A917I2Q6_9FLAO|nr:hypothetical protein [Polaribacter pacificus]GGH03956.1 hypothetical protein GCM10011416_23820 [Polaribacter pacificus]
MEHFNFELEEKFDKGNFNEYLADAKTSIAAENGPVDFEVTENIINKIFNGYTGVYEKYNIIKKGVLIGFLEAFVDNNLEYMNIFTSPLN